MSLLLLLKPKGQGVVIPPEEPPAAPPVLLGAPKRKETVRILRVRAGTARVVFRALAPELALELEGGTAGPIRFARTPNPPTARINGKRVRVTYELVGEATVNGKPAPLKVSRK